MMDDWPITSFPPPIQWFHLEGGFHPIQVPLSFHLSFWRLQTRRAPSQIVLAESEQQSTGQVQGWLGERVAGCGQAHAPGTAHGLPGLHCQFARSNFDWFDGGYWCWWCPPFCPSCQYPKANLEPSPFVEVTLGRTTQRSPVKPKTVNPLYQAIIWRKKSIRIQGAREPVHFPSLFRVNSIFLWNNRKAKSWKSEP